MRSYSSAVTWSPPSNGLSRVEASACRACSQTCATSFPESARMRQTSSPFTFTSVSRTASEPSVMLSTAGALAITSKGATTVGRNPMRRTRAPYRPGAGRRIENWPVLLVRPLATAGLVAAAALFASMMTTMTPAARVIPSASTTWPRTRAAGAATCAAATTEWAPIATARRMPRRTVTGGGRCARVPSSSMVRRLSRG